MPREKRSVWLTKEGEVWAIHASDRKEPVAYRETLAAAKQVAREEAKLLGAVFL